jgi:hypothetical protein
MSRAAMGGRELLAWNLRLLRTARGLSQERLAAHDPDAAPPQPLPNGRKLGDRRR